MKSEVNILYKFANFSKMVALKKLNIPFWNFKISPETATRGAL